MPGAQNTSGKWVKEWKHDWDYIELIFELRLLNSSRKHLGFIKPWESTVSSWSLVSKSELKIS